MTSSAHQRAELYEQLLTISRQAFAEAAFEVAYHTLSAAAHRARELNDLPLLRKLLQEVERQKKELDNAYPSYRLSSFSANGRGHEGVYSALERQISTQIQFYEAQGTLQERKRQDEHSERRSIRE